MLRTTASIEGAPDQVAAPVRPDTTSSPKSSKTHALPIQRPPLPSAYPLSAFLQSVRGRRRTVTNKTEVLVRVGRDVEEVSQHRQHFVVARSHPQRDGQVPPGNQRDGQCSSGRRKSAT